MGSSTHYKGTQSDYERGLEKGIVKKGHPAWINPELRKPPKPKPKPKKHLYVDEQEV